MFKRIAEAIMTSYRQETLAERGKRMVPGVMYGAIASTVYVLVSSIINVIFFPGLHLGVDWISLLTHWIEFGLALALAGAIVGWFTEDYMGIVGGGVVLTILLLVGNLIASLMGGGSAALTVQSFITALPLVGVGVLLAWAIRVAINHHLHIQQQETPEVRRKLFVQLTTIVFLVGLIPGAFSRFGLSSEYAIRTLNESLQNVATDPSLDVRFPIAKVPALKNHFGMNYTLFARVSAFEAGAMDITIHFEDGYTVTCLVPTESGYATFLQVCNEGTKITSPSR
ncbi:MAG TPA: hypothetical protein VII97_07705 [Anaerolineales bacterium]